MNNVHYGQVSSTFSYALVAAGLLSSSLQMPAPFIEHAVDYGHKGIFQRSYAADGNAPTFNTFGSHIVGVYNLTINGFERAVGNFYNRLLTSQEPLGAEFEKVLYANLWDLYES